jgi:hypothetical protein
MLVGHGDLDVLAANAPTLPSWRVEPVACEGVTCFQLVAELRRPAREALLPVALHPTEPPSLSLQAWKVEASPWGPFTWVVARLSCRSGVRARGYSLAALASTDAAATGLREGFGFPCRVADVRLSVHYDGVELDAGPGLRFSGIDPTPLGDDDVQYTGTMNLAHTPNGLRLVQVEVDHRITRLQRVKGRIDRFDAPAWGDARLDPYWVVAATVADEASATLPPVRFVCRADVDAFAGTEKVR